MQKESHLPNKESGNHVVDVTELYTYPNNSSELLPSRESFLTSSEQQKFKALAITNNSNNAPPKKSKIGKHTYDPDNILSNGLKLPFGVKSQQLLSKMLEGDGEVIPNTNPPPSPSEETHEDSSSVIVTSSQTGTSNPNDGTGDGYGDKPHTDSSDIESTETEYRTFQEWYRLELKERVAHVRLKRCVEEREEFLKKRWPLLLGSSRGYTQDDLVLEEQDQDVHFLDRLDQCSESFISFVAEDPGNFYFDAQSTEYQAASPKPALWHMNAIPIEQLRTGKHHIRRSDEYENRLFWIAKMYSDHQMGRLLRGTSRGSSRMHPRGSKGSVKPKHQPMQIPPGQWCSICNTNRHAEDKCFSVVGRFGNKKPRGGSGDKQKMYSSSNKSDEYSSLNVTHNSVNTIYKMRKVGTNYGQLNPLQRLRESVNPVGSIHNVRLSRVTGDQTNSNGELWLNCSMDNVEINDEIDNGAAFSA
ncbi:hypothetical protein P9112_002291 [Eukaryota sp. TZLM1-RC]